MLRVVFQGGGARVGALLAAADSLKRVCEQSELPIHSVSGVSAGSIAGAVLASPAPIRETVAKLYERAPAFINAFDREYKLVAHLFDSEMQSLFKRLQVKQKNGQGIGPKLAYDVFKAVKARTPSLVKLVEMQEGHPLVRFRELEEALQYVFTFEGRDLTFADLIDRPLTVFSSDLNAGGRKQYDAATHSDLPIYKAIAASCAMPGIFRGFVDGNSEFDGGLAGNLPYPDLPLADDPTLRTICISFPGKGSEISNVVDFGMSLLHCAMNSAVREAILQANESGGLVFELPEEVGTFEWQKAMARLQPKAFGDDSTDIDDRLRESLNQLFGNGSFKLVRKSRFGSDDVAAVFDRIYRSFPVKKEQSLRIYISGDTRRRKRADRVLDDERFFVDTFVPLKNQIVVCQVTLSYNLQRIGSLAVEVKDQNGNDLKFEAYLHRSEDRGAFRHRVLVFFDQPVGPAEGKVTVTVREEGDTVWNKDREWDYFTTRAIMANDVDEVVWLGTCKSNGKYTYTPEELSLIDGETKSKLDQLLNRTVEFENWASGTALTTDSAKKIIKSYCKDFLVQDFDCWAWKAGPVSNKMGAGVLVRRSATASNC